MLRRHPPFLFSSRTTTILLGQSRYMSHLERSRRDFASNHSGEVPLSQSQPTFAVPKSPKGEWRGIDTTFVDIPDIAEAKPMPEEVRDALYSLHRQQQEQKQKQMNVDMRNKTRRTEQLKLLRGEKKDTKKGGKKLVSSSSSSSSLSLVDSDKQQQKEQEQDQEEKLQFQQEALDHFTNRLTVAKSLFKMCENFVLMNQEGFLTVTALHEKNSGPEYEQSDMKLKRRRAWFSLRHAFLSACPSLFAFSEQNKRFLKFLEEENNDNDNNNNNNNNGGSGDDYILNIALEALNESSGLLSWMENAAKLSGRWSQQNSWDRRPETDYDEIDFGKLTHHLLQQYSMLMKEISSSSSASFFDENNNNILVPLDRLAALYVLAEKYHVEKVTIENAFPKEVMMKILNCYSLPTTTTTTTNSSSSSIDLSVNNNKNKKPKLTSVNAVALGLACDPKLLSLFNNNNNNNDNNGDNNDNDNNNNIPTILLQAAISDPKLQSFSGVELIFLLQFLQRIQLANPQIDFFEFVVAGEKEAKEKEGEKEQQQEETKINLVRIFQTALLASQQRMRILMHHKIGIYADGTNNFDLKLEESEVILEDALFPLKKFMEHRAQNNPTHSNSVVEYFDLHRRLGVEGMREGGIKRSSEAIKFFKVFTEITRRKKNKNMMMMSNNNNKKEAGNKSNNNNIQQNENNENDNENDDDFVYICNSWINDVISKAAADASGKREWMIQMPECLLILESLAAVSSSSSSSQHQDQSNNNSNNTRKTKTRTELAVNLKKIKLIVEKTIKDQAIYLSGEDTVKIFKYLGQVQPLLFSTLFNSSSSSSSREEDLSNYFSCFWSQSCLDALELRLLRMDTNTMNNNKNTPNRLNLEQISEIVKSFTPLNYFPRLALQEFALVAATSISSSSYRKKEEGEEQEEELQQAMSIAVCLAAQEQQQQQNSTTATNKMTNNNNNDNNNNNNNNNNVRNSNRSGRRIQASAALTNLITTICSIIAPPPTVSSSSSTKKLQKSSSSKITTSKISNNNNNENNNLLLFSTLQLVGLIPHTRENLRITIPTHKACEQLLFSLLSSSSSFEKQNFVVDNILSQQSSSSLLNTARGFSKLKIELKKQQQQNSKTVSKQIFSELMKEAALGNSYSFTELSEVLTLSISSSSQDNDDEKNICIVTQHIINGLNVCRKSILSSSSFNSNKRRNNNNNNELSADVDLDFESLMISSFQILKVIHNENNNNLKSSSSSFNKQLEMLSQTAIRFLVCCFAYQSYLQQQQQQQNQNHFSASSKSTSQLLGFEGPHLVKKQQEKLVAKRTERFGLLLQQSLALAGEEGKKVAEEEWKESFA